MVFAACVAGWLPGHALAAPANDNFANAQQLSGLPALASGNNDGATREPGEPNHAGAFNDASIWYSWTAPVSGRIRVKTCDSFPDTALGVYTGAAVAALTQIASNDDGCEDLEGSSLTFTATAGTVYRIAVDSSADEAGAIALSIRAVPPPPKPRPGRYLGRTFLGGKVSFRLSRSRRLITRLRIAFYMDCQLGRANTVLHPRRVRVRRDYRFRIRTRERFRDGSRIVTDFRGRFRPPNRVSGRVAARATFAPVGRCFTPFRGAGDIEWSARRR